MTDHTKQLKAWDIRRHEGTGDENPEVVYAAVGKALHNWNKLEQTLSVLFSRFICQDEFMKFSMIMYAHGAVRTFEGRLEMLRKVSEAYFWSCPDSSEKTDLQKQVKDFLNKKCQPAGERRNDIAHGVLIISETVTLGPIEKREKGCFWGPAGTDSSKRAFLGKEKFSYSSKELNHYANLFLNLSKEGDQITSAIFQKTEPFWKKSVQHNP